MTAVVKEVYEAFKKIGIPEQDAWEAAAALSTHEARFAELKTEMTEIRGELRLHRWMLGVVVALNVGILLKLLVS